MIFRVPDTFGIAWCASSLTTASEGTSISYRTSRRGAPLADLS
jgi:hypothetical protein